jgi:hypothetical protein
MAGSEDMLIEALREVREALDRVDSLSPADALPHLRTAQLRLTAAIDETMALAIVEQGTSIRQAGALAGLSENSVPPRLAMTDALAAYSDESGRVSARAVERARYDRERGTRPAPAAAAAPLRAPMTFRRRRPD